MVPPQVSALLQTVLSIGRLFKAYPAADDGSTTAAAVDRSAGN